MSDQHECILGIVLAVFGAIGTSIQLLAMETPGQKYSAFIASGVFWLVAAIYLYKGNAHRLAVTAIGTRLFWKAGTLSIRIARSEGEVREVCWLDKRTFGSFAISADLGVDWWKKYANGLITLWKDHELVGYVSFWPVTKGAFEKLLKGAILEHQIRPRDIVGAGEQLYWYVGSIVLTIRFRRTRAASKLMAGVMEKWAGNLPFDQPIHVCALGYSRDGERLLKRFDFHCHAHADESPHRLPVYCLKSDRGTIERVLHSVAKSVSSKS